MSGRSRVFIAIAIVAVGAVAYAFLGTTTAVDESRLSRLVVPATGFKGFKPHPLKSSIEPPSKSPSSVVKAAGASHPTETGIVQVAWSASTKENEAGVMVQLLPTPAEARAVLAELKSDYSAPKKVSAESLTLVDKFTVTALPGAFAARYAPTSSKTSSADIYIVLFQVDRVAAFVVVDVSSSAVTEKDAGALAVSEAQHIRRVELGFTLAQTVRPFLRALWFALGTVLVAGAVLAFPRIRRFMTDRRERMEDRARLREQRHVRARGSKVMRRQSVPAWQRPRSTGRRRSGR
jgi:hypothetical protein